MTDAPAADAAPPVARVLETALYVDDLVRASRFYDRLFGFPTLFADARLIAYDVGGLSVLLLFVRGSSDAPQQLPGGTIPAHDGAGPLHVAFAIEAGALDRWERRLAAESVGIESRLEWPCGGVSLYFRDPDGHLLEFATPGLWRTY